MNEHSRSTRNLLMEKANASPNYSPSHCVSSMATRCHIKRDTDKYTYLHQTTCTLSIVLWSFGLATEMEASTGLRGRDSRDRCTPTPSHCSCTHSSVLLPWSDNTHSSSPCSFHACSHPLCGKIGKACFCNLDDPFHRLPRKRLFVLLCECSHTFGL